MSDPNILPMNAWGNLIVDEPNRAVVALNDPITGQSITGPNYDQHPVSPPEYFASDPALKPGYDYWRKSHTVDPEAQLTVCFTDPTNPNGFDIDDFRDNVIGRTPHTRNYDVVLYDFVQGVYDTERAKHEREQRGLPYDPVIAEVGVHEEFLDRFFDVIDNTGAVVRPIDVPMEETESGLLVPTEKSARIVKALRETVYPLALEQDFSDPEGPEAGFMSADVVSENHHQHYTVGRSGAILHQMMAPRVNQGVLPDVLVVMPNGQRDVVRKFLHAGARNVGGHNGVERDQQTVDDNQRYQTAMETGRIEFEFEA